MLSHYVGAHYALVHYQNVHYGYVANLPEVALPPFAAFDIDLMRSVDRALRRRREEEEVVMIIAMAVTKGLLH